MVDNEKLLERFKSVSGYEEYFNLYGTPLVKEAVGELDEKVTNIRSYLNRCRELDLDFDMVSLQRIVIDLSSCIYYTTDRFEKLQLLADVSKMSYKNAYNEAYINKQGTHDAGTKYSVQQLQAYSETVALEDNIINFIYTRAASVVESKLEAAQELLKVCSKSLSGLIQSMQTFGIQNKFS